MFTILFPKALRKRSTSIISSLQFVLFTIDNYDNWTEDHNWWVTGVTGVD